MAFFLCSHFMSHGINPFSFLIIIAPQDRQNIILINVQVQDINLLHSQLCYFDLHRHFILKEFTSVAVRSCPRICYRKDFPPASVLCAQRMPGAVAEPLRGLKVGFPCSWPPASPDISSTYAPWPLPSCFPLCRSLMLFRLAGVRKQRRIMSSGEDRNVLPSLNVSSAIVKVNG